MSSPEISNSRPCWSQTTKLVVGIFLVIFGIAGIYFFRTVLVPLIIGGILAYLLHPIVRGLSRLTRLPHGIATGAIYLLLLAIVISGGATLGSVAVAQVNGLLLYLQQEYIEFAEYLENLSGDSIMLLNLEISVEEITNQIASALTELITSAGTESISIVFDVAETLFMGIFVSLIAFYLTRDSEKFGDFLQGIIPMEYRDDIRMLAAEIDGIWAGFFRGQLILAVLIAIMVTVLCMAVGFPQPVLMGIFAGFMEFLLSVGHTIWLITALIIGLIEGSTYLPISNLAFAFVILLVQAIYTQIDLNILIPRIIGRQVHLHPMIVILGIIIGATVGGVLGIVLAAPTIATLRVLGRYVYARLLDLDPFPLVGPVAAPPEERAACADQEIGPPGLSVPGPRELIERIRERGQEGDNE
jgi:predicted PurR-regulated permease PerM